MANCIRCHRDIPDDSRFCLYCGRRQGTAPQRKKARRPRGTGSITKTTGHPSKPYLARLSGRYVGRYAGAEEAKAALTQAQSLIVSRGQDSQYIDWTLAQVYEAVISDRAWASKSPSYLRDTRSTWKYMEELHDLKASNVYVDDFQGVIYRAQDEGKSPSHQKKLRTLAIKLCTWCRSHGIHAYDRAEGLTIAGKDQRERVAFADADLATIYRHRSERAAGIIWFLCATGCRLADLPKIRKNSDIDTANQGIWLEGSKTRAGKGRYIKLDPITWRDVFLPLYIAAAPGAVIFTSPTGAAWSSDNFRHREFYPALANMGIQPVPKKGELAKYIPYTCRHTFATLADRAAVDKAVLQRAIGHEIGSSVTDAHYVDRTQQVQDATLEFAKLAATLQKFAT